MTSTNEFSVYPAIDLRRGKVVRLKQGDPKKQTVFSDDPIEIGLRWLSQGAKWLHVVNLDGALDAIGQMNWQHLPGLVALGAQVQFGGGLRTLNDIERALDLGVTRVVLGTVAVENPRLVAEAIDRFGTNHIAAGLDARNGLIRIHGWQQRTEVTALALARRLSQTGLRTIIYTDIGRDGVFSGVNVADTANLARASGLNVVASGGVSSLADVRDVRSKRGAGLVGLIIGRALYEGKIELAEALAMATGSSGSATKDKRC